MNTKILLVYEEYSEMINVQGILQKVGFDVLSITTEYTLSENVLNFNPDVVVAHGRAGKVTTIGCGRRLREMTRWQGKVVLILPTGYKPNPQDFAKIRADMLLEAPVPPLRVMQIVAKMLGHDEAVLAERLSKHGNEVTKPEGPGIVNGTLEGNPDLTMVSGALPKDSPEFIKGTESDEDEESFLKAKAKFNLDLLAESPEKPKAKKDDPDLESLWKELTGHSELSITPEEEVAAKAGNQKLQFDLSNERSLEMGERDLERLKKDLQNAQKSGAERVSKYEKYLAQIQDFDPRQGLSKMASRQVQKDLVKDWNNKEIEDQDEARRKFTKALFTKK